MAHQQRNIEMALLTVFAMVLVVIGHSDITADYKNLWIYKWVYSFHMPLFFFISGFLFCFTNPSERLKHMPYMLFVKKKFVRLVLPFLFINTIIYVCKSGGVVDESVMQHPVSVGWNSFVASTLYHPLGFMWFLPTLFMIFILIFPWWKLIVRMQSTKKMATWILIVLTFLVVIIVNELLPKVSFMQISMSIYYLRYFLLGVLYCVYKSTIDKMFFKYKYMIIPVSCLVSISLLSQGFMAALSGIIFSLNVALILSHRDNERMIQLSKYCYTVFLLSYFPQMFIRGPIAHHFSEVNQYWFSMLSFVSGLVCPLVIAWFYTKFKNRYPALERVGFLIGL